MVASARHAPASSPQKDASVSWTTATDGVQEERVYYCQELRSGRADVVHLIDTSGARVESVRYSPYGVPFGIPYVDFNADGAKTSADQTLLTAATGYSAGSGSYSVACDINLDGTVDSTDQSLYTGYSGGTLGRGNMSRNIVRNRKGYAGYEHDGILDSIMHVRHRVYESELGRWVQRDPLGFVDGGSLYGYVHENPVSTTDSNFPNLVSDIKSETQDTTADSHDVAAAATPGGRPCVSVCTFRCRHLHSGTIIIFGIGRCPPSSPVVFGDPDCAAAGRAYCSCLYFTNDSVHCYILAMIVFEWRIATPL